MRVISLCVEGYRNLRSFTFLPGPGVNVVYGDNAQGKTNLAEALWLFCGQKSFRGSRDGELVSFDGSAAKLKLRFFAEEREQESELLIDTARHASLNGVKLSSPTELSRRFCAVVFSPEHLSFVKEGPGVRRRFLDSAIIQLRPKYGSLLAGYHRAVKQRNVLLRDSVRHSELLELLSAYEYHIARFGAGILAKRRSYVEALRKEAPEIYKGLSGGREKLSITYQCTCGGGSEEEMIAALKASRETDFRLGSTTVGPHRDDVDLEIDQRSCRLYGSQGQQRSAVLALKLAEAAILKRHFKEQPIAVLDDVMSELDAARQDYILNHMEGWQVFITCCDPAAVLRLSGGRAFFMADGMLSQAGKDEEI